MTATAPNRDSVAMRAYFAWEGEGRIHGRHEHHWLAAETAEALSVVEVRASVPVLAPAQPAAPVKSAPAKKAAAKKAAPAKAAAPKAPAETVVAAAALAAPRAARTSAKGARRVH